MQAFDQVEKVHFQESKQCIDVEDILVSDVCKKVKFVSFSDNKILHVLKRFKNLQIKVMSRRKKKGILKKILIIKKIHKI